MTHQLAAWPRLPQNTAGLNPAPLSVQLRGSSVVQIGCQCIQPPDHWLRDPLGNSMCPRCKQTWHHCAVHQVSVPGPVPKETGVCSCHRRAWKSPHQQSCPYCTSPIQTATKVHQNTTTLNCQVCHQFYHICPLHGNTVKGPGYPSTSLGQSFCQCHQQLAFLNKSWSKPYQ